MGEKLDFLSARDRFEVGYWDISHALKSSERHNYYEYKHNRLSH